MHVIHKPVRRIHGEVIFTAMFEQAQFILMLMQSEVFDGFLNWYFFANKSEVFLNQCLHALLEFFEFFI